MLKKFTITVLAAMLAVTSLAGVTAQDEDASSDTGTIAVEVGPGPFYVAIDDVQFEDAQYNYEPQTLNAQMTIEIVDWRGSFEGWRVLFSSTHLWNQDRPNSRIPTQWISITGWTIEHTRFSGNRVAGVHTGALPEAEGEQVVAVRGPRQFSTGEYKAHADLELNLPARIPPGNFEGTMTVNLVAGP